MKRILVLDDSDAVRETIALLLESDFSVMKRALGAEGLSFADLEHDVELLIIGVASAVFTRAPGLLNFAARRHFAVLFLVETKSLAESIRVQENIGCLIKPFNPYELKAEVARLLARPILRSPSPGHPREAQNRGLTRYLEFPYLNRVAASLVYRFAATQLPVLISGEIGCGQERVARAMHGLAENPGSRLVLTAAEINEQYLARRRSDIAACRERGDGPVTLLIEEIDRLSPPEQSLLLAFIEEELEKFNRCRFFTTSKADLLEKVYSGKFLELLYYQLATLNLALAPLRERREDIPVLARWFSQFYAKELGLAEVSFTPAANERLSQYLWFGNLNEMDTVVARTLTVHRKSRIEESDLIFDFDAGRTALQLPELEGRVHFEPRESEKSKAGKNRAVPSHPPENGSDSGGAAGPMPDLRVLIHELAHELKNPMVTIKAFAQLLTDRYQDEDFRARFQNVVDGDIERIDDLLEIMIEFADFSQPRKITIPLEEQLRLILAEINEECAERQVRLGWKENTSGAKIMADEAQVKYVLKNALLAVLFHAKTGSEIEIGVEKPARVTISYLREGGRVASVAHFLSAPAAEAEESILPLRMLLAKHLLERNGGWIKMNHAEGDRETLEMEFPIA